MQKRKLRKTKLVPAPTLSAFEEMCRTFHLDPNRDFNATQKLRIWYRACQKQVIVF